MLGHRFKRPKKTQSKPRRKDWPPEEEGEKVGRLGPHALAGLDAFSVHGAIRRGLPGTRRRSGIPPFPDALPPGLEREPPKRDRQLVRPTPAYWVLDGTQGIPEPDLYEDRLKKAYDERKAAMAMTSPPPTRDPEPLRKRGQGMYTKQNYQRAVTAYRETGINHSQVSRQLGWSLDATRKLYKQGWRGISWARPIAEVIEEDVANGKAAALAAEEMERREIQARAAVAKGKFDEAIQLEEHILTAARKNVAAAYALSSQLLPAVTSAVAYVRETLCVRVSDATGEKWVPRKAAELKAAGIDPVFALKIIERYALVMQRITGTADRVMDQSRLNRGAPTEVIEERHTAVFQMSAEEAMLEINDQAESIRLIALQANADKEQRQADRKLRMTPAELRRRMYAQTRNKQDKADAAAIDTEGAPVDEDDLEEDLSETVPKLSVGEQVTYAEPLGEDGTEEFERLPELDDNFG